MGTAANFMGDPSDFDIFQASARAKVGSCVSGLPRPASAATRWCPPSDVCWFIIPINYRYNPLINPSEWTYKPT